MCFHTSQIQPVKQLEQHYQVKLSDENQRDLFNTPRYHINGFSHAQLLIIPQEKPEVLAAATWGIAPEHKKVNELQAYYKAAVKFGGGLNARAEKGFDHFLYKKSVFSKRCIIPVSAFFEPHEHNKTKYPFVFKPKSSDFLSLAGIYTRIENVVSFSIFTHEASPLFAKIHNKKNRQPVILHKSVEKKWLSSDLQKQEMQHILQTHFNEDELEYHPVSKDLFQPKINSDVEGILNRVAYKELIIPSI